MGSGVCGVLQEELNLLGSSVRGKSFKPGEDAFRSLLKIWLLVSMKDSEESRFDIGNFTGIGIPALMSSNCFLPSGRDFQLCKSETVARKGHCNECETASVSFTSQSCSFPSGHCRRAFWQEQGTPTAAAPVKLPALRKTCSLPWSCLCGSRRSRRSSVRKRKRQSFSKFYSSLLWKNSS